MPDYTMRSSPDSPVGIIHDWYDIYPDPGDINDGLEITLTS